MSRLCALYGQIAVGKAPVVVALDLVRIHLVVSSVIAESRVVVALDLMEILVVGIRVALSLVTAESIVVVVAIDPVGTRVVLPVTAEVDILEVATPVTAESPVVVVFVVVASPVAVRLVAA